MTERLCLVHDPLALSKLGSHMFEFPINIAQMRCMRHADNRISCWSPGHGAQLLVGVTQTDHDGTPASPQDITSQGLMR